jgi:RNA-directed DNA polymerase
MMRWTRSRSQITTKKVNWVLDADIRDFFGQLDQAWLRKFLEHRIADRRILRLIDKWLAAGSRAGPDMACRPCGARRRGHRLGPLLANVYLHYVLHLWVHWWRHHEARGDVIVVRFG